MKRRSFIGAIAALVAAPAFTNADVAASEATLPSPDTAAIKYYPSDMGCIAPGTWVQLDGGFVRPLTVNRIP